MKNNFRFGVPSYGMPILGGGLIPATTGTYFFVSSDTGNDANRGLTSSRPLATLDKAIGLCTADKGDVIIIMPGHSEDLDEAGAITCDIAGVYIIGLGTGTLRPTFTFSETDSTILVTAANVSMVNLSFNSSKAELVTCITVSGAGFTMDSCVVTDTATSMINFLTSTAAADDLTIKNCHFITDAIPTANAFFITIVGGDSVTIVDNYFSVLTSNHGSSGTINGVTTASTGVLIARNVIYSIGTSVVAIVMYTGTTGLIISNRIGGTKTNAAGIITNESTYEFDNLSTNDVTASGFVDPAIDSAG